MSLFFKALMPTPLRDTLPCCGTAGRCTGMGTGTKGGGDASKSGVEGIAPGGGMAGCNVVGLEPMEKAGIGICSGASQDHLPYDYSYMLLILLDAINNIVDPQVFSWASKAA